MYTAAGLNFVFTPETNKGHQMSQQARRHNAFRGGQYNKQAGT
jgi:hypothetical protein